MTSTKVRVETRMEKLARWIESHPPTRAWVNLDGDGVTVKSSWVDLATGTEGTDFTTVRTWGEARDVLGY